MTEVVHKGGQFIVQDDGQKGVEATYLALFTRHKLGERWIQENGITTKTSSESPDFIFKVPDRPTIGLEIVNFVNKSAKNMATMRLEEIAKKIVGYFKKQGIALTLLIDIQDLRDFSMAREDFLNMCYNPGFDKLNGTDKEIKDALVAKLKPIVFNLNGVAKASADVKGQIFIATVCKMYAPHTSAHVNNQGMCIENPFEDLQKTIYSKNKKFEQYKKNCDECDLLVVVENSFVHLSDKLQKHKFDSVFRDVYVLDLSYGCKVTKLKLRHSRNKKICGNTADVFSPEIPDGE